jgi:hypothetical protein
VLGVFVVFVVVGVGVGVVLWAGLAAGAVAVAVEGVASALFFAGDFSEGRLSFL